MTIEVRQLRYAVLTADMSSLSRAAAALNMRQATLSQRVTQLEDQLGIKLFTRSTRGAEPTEMGKVFIESARRIITDIDNLQTTARAVSYGEQGRLAVGYSSSLMAGNLKQTFSDYLVRFPDVQFDGVEAGPSACSIACKPGRSMSRWLRQVWKRRGYGRDGSGRIV